MTPDELLERLRDRATEKQRLPAPEICRLIRKNAGVTLPEMAEVVGVTRQAISYYESGQRRPRGDHLARYARALRTLQGSS